jgi:hypothetical protein
MSQSEMKLRPGIDRGASLAYQRTCTGAGSSVVEHVTFNHVVVGSTPTRLTIFSNDLLLSRFSSTKYRLGKHLDFQHDCVHGEDI